MGALMDNTEKNYDINLEQIKQIRKTYFWRTAFFGLIILVAGIVIGGASMSILAEHNFTASPARRENSSLMPRLRQILGLTQQQATKIKPILDKHMQHLQEIRDDARVDIISTLTQMNQEISPILSAGQKVVWSNELLRIQRELNPEPLPSGGGGAGWRRGAEQPGPGPGGGRRNAGRGGQPRGGMGPRRGIQSMPALRGPNSFSNNTPENQIMIENSDSNSSSN